jgi:hypothetical protein
MSEASGSFVPNSEINADERAEFVGQFQAFEVYMRTDPELSDGDHRFRSTPPITIGSESVELSIDSGTIPVAKSGSTSQEDVARILEDSLKGTAVPSFAVIDGRGSLEVFSSTTYTLESERQRDVEDLGRYSRIKRWRIIEAGGVSEPSFEIDHRVFNEKADRWHLVTETDPDTLGLLERIDQDEVLDFSIARMLRLIMPARRTARPGSWFDADRLQESMKLFEKLRKQLRLP